MEAYCGPCNAIRTDVCEVPHTGQTITEWSVWTESEISYQVARRELTTTKLATAMLWIERLAERGVTAVLAVNYR